MFIKKQAIAIAALGACALFASVQAGEGTVNCIVTLPIAELTVTTTTITTVTDENGNIIKENKATTRKVVDAISPDLGDYSYEEYDGVLLPYYRGYYYIDGVWVWRGRGKAPIPPPKFRPRPAPKPGAGKAAAPAAKPVSAKSSAGLNSSSARSVSSSPAPARTVAPKPARTVRTPKAPKAPKAAGRPPR